MYSEAGEQIYETRLFAGFLLKLSVARSALSRA